MGRICTVNGCAREVRARDWCNMHWQRWYKSGDPSYSKIDRETQKGDEYRIWCHVKERCNNPNCKSWVRYGGRGIKVCAEWDSSFASFLKDMGRRPTAKHSIERINNSKGYQPGNCRWATAKEQCNNRRSNVLLTCNGRTQTVTEWAAERGINYFSLRSRIQRGWSTRRALGYES
jgi:hypothetical protein